MFNRSFVFVVAFLCSALNGCANEISSTSSGEGSQAYAMTFRFPSSMLLAAQPWDPEGELILHDCREMSGSGTEPVTTCRVAWKESGEPGVLSFDLIARADGHSLCEARAMRDNTFSVPLMVELPNGQSLHISPAIRATSRERCHFTVATDRLEQ